MTGSTGPPPSKTPRGFAATPLLVERVSPRKPPFWVWGALAASLALALYGADALRHPEADWGAIFSDIFGWGALILSAMFGLPAGVSLLAWFWRIMVLAASRRIPEVVTAGRRE